MSAQAGYSVHLEKLQKEVPEDLNEKSKPPDQRLDYDNMSKGLKTEFETLIADFRSIEANGRKVLFKTFFE
jgi:hypothetical protein